jgi:hypothetical protein
MINYNKQEITKTVYKQIPDPLKYFPDETIDKLYFKWWATGRSGSGFQLSYAGMLAFQYAEIQFYQFDLTTELDVIKINKLMPCPFYVNYKSVKPYLRVYDNKTAMIITLYGSVKEYIHSIESYISR